MFALLLLGSFNQSGLAIPLIDHSTLSSKGQAGYSQVIRVRIISGAPQVTMRGYDLTAKASEKSQSFSNFSQGLAGWQLTCQNNRISAYQVVGKNIGSIIQFTSPLVLESPSGFLQVRGNSYRERLKVYSGITGCEVVNHVNLEKYLEGVVNAEISSKWSESAIAAQVIVARTYALFQLGKRQKRFDLESSDKDQVYLGSQIEDSRSAKAVKSTQGLILTSQPHGNDPIKAFYHSTCGGLTELPERVWGASFPGYSKRVTCPFCKPSPRYQWQVKLSNEDIAQLIYQGAKDDPYFSINKNLGLLQRSSLLAVQTERPGDSSRVSKVRMTWQDQSSGRRFEFPVSGVRLRNWIGTSRLLSSSFSMQTSGRGQWMFKGQGFGHGVGMCQWGAKTMGEKGFSSVQILKQYYPDAFLKKIW